MMAKKKDGSQSGGGEGKKNDGYLVGGGDWKKKVPLDSQMLATLKASYN